MEERKRYIERKRKKKRKRWERKSDKCVGKERKKYEEKCDGSETKEKVSVCLYCLNNLFQHSLASPIVHFPNPQLYKNKSLLLILCRS